MLFSALRFASASFCARSASACCSAFSWLPAARPLRVRPAAAARERRPSSPPPCASPPLPSSGAQPRPVAWPFPRLPPLGRFAFDLPLLLPSGGLHLFFRLELRRRFLLQALSLCLLLGLLCLSSASRRRAVSRARPSAVVRRRLPFALPRRVLRFGLGLLLRPLSLGLLLGFFLYCMPLGRFALGLALLFEGSCLLCFLGLALGLRLLLRPLGLRLLLGLFLWLMPLGFALGLTLLFEGSSCFLGLALGLGLLLRPLGLGLLLGFFLSCALLGRFASCVAVRERRPSSLLPP